MRPSRVAGIPIVVAVVLLAGCGGSNHAGSGTTTSSSAPTPAPSSTPSVSAETTLPAPSTTSPPATTTTHPAPVVQILSFTGPRSPVDCNAPTQIQLHWRTRGASKVELRIDANPTFATFPGGARDPLVPLACDGGGHVYEIVATGANGQTATKQLRLEERKLIS